jgi:hypothetical protein
VPQEKRPGEEAEVDFAEVWLDLAGQRRKCVLFTLRMSYSGKAVHRVCATAAQEVFSEGHVEASRLWAVCRPATSVTTTSSRP